MLKNKKCKLNFKFILLALIFSAVCYLLGTYNPNLTSATRKIMKEQKTWQLQYHSTNLRYGRPGFWVSIFKPRFTGAIGYVSYTNKKSGEIYLLLTLQKRVINGKYAVVCEPAAGFFNGEYPAKISHDIAENAEKTIEHKYKLGEIVDHTKIYKIAEEIHLKNNNENIYINDPDLWQTTIREIKEETSLDLSNLNGNSKSDFTISKKEIRTYESQNVYISIKHISVIGTKDTPPKLQNIFPTEEVILAEWIPIKNIDIQNKLVRTSTGIVPLKPAIYILNSIEEIVNSYK